MELSAFICCFIALIHIINAGLFGSSSGDRTFSTYCEWTAPFFGAPTIHRYEGKFNVPIVPKEYSDTTLFLWPGVNPDASEHGLMQPVLTYYTDYVPAGTWGISNWFSNCDPSIVMAQDSGQYFCWDDYKVVQEGDTILFYMQYIETYRNGSQHWEMGWSSYNNKSYGQTKQCYRVTKDVQTLWATEAEFYIDSSDSSNFNKLPASTFYTWDIIAYTNTGSKYDLSWDTINKDPQPGKSVDCNVNVPIHGQPKSGSAIYFPNNNGCTLSGYSRDWNSICADYCGCKNVVDGSAKVQCDYCCNYNRLTAKCNREDASGPSYDFNDYTEDAYTKECNDGYSRKWDYECQSACGCNNADGTPKNKCDYCCGLAWYAAGGYDYCDAQIPNTPSPTKRPTTMSNNTKSYTFSNSTK